jgi:hypothetical protein
MAGMAPAFAQTTFIEQVHPPQPPPESLSSASELAAARAYDHFHPSIPRTSSGSSRDSNRPAVLEGYVSLQTVILHCNTDACVRCVHWVDTIASARRIAFLRKLCKFTETTPALIAGTLCGLRAGHNAEIGTRPTSLALTWPS